MLTRKQHELLTFIHERLGESGVSPSFEEMKEALELKSKSGVHRLISALEERARPVRQPPDELAFLQSGDQSVHAGLRLQVECVLHLFERRGNAALRQTIMDEAEQFMLLARQHCRPSPERTRNMYDARP